MLFSGLYIYNVDLQVWNKTSFHCVTWSEGWTFNLTLWHRKRRPNSVPKAVAFDIHRVWTQLNVVFLSTSIETQRIQCDFKLWAYTNQSAGHWFQNAIPLELDCKQLGFGVGLQISQETLGRLQNLFFMLKKKNVYTGEKKLKRKYKCIICSSIPVWVWEPARLRM